MNYYKTKDYSFCFHHPGKAHCECNDVLELYINRNWDLKQKLNGLYNLATSLIRSLDIKEWEESLPSREEEIRIDLRNLKLGLRDLRKEEKEDWRDLNS